MGGHGKLDKLLGDFGSFAGLAHEQGQAEPAAWRCTPRVNDDGPVDATWQRDLFHVLPAALAIAVVTVVALSLLW